MAANKWIPSIEAVKQQAPREPNNGALLSDPRQEYMRWTDAKPGILLSLWTSSGISRLLASRRLGYFLKADARQCGHTHTHKLPAGHEAPNFQRGGRSSSCGRGILSGGSPENREIKHASGSCLLCCALHPESYQASTIQKPPSETEAHIILCRASAA